jgi:NADH:ubiquinone oxidoreductase subunit 4 (subunit M)
MYQRVFFGGLSEFLHSLSSHLTDLRPIEILTLVPLGTVVVLFGIFPGLVLDLVQGTVASVLHDVSVGTAINLLFWQ